MQNRLMIKLIYSQFITLLFLMNLLSFPAYAHDVLVAASPEKNQVLVQSPTEIVLTFNNNLFNLGASFAVRDLEGKEYAVGEAIIAENTVTQIVENLVVSGEYKVAWRVVSSDGHPISGSYSFLLELANDIALETDTSDNPSLNKEEVIQKKGVIKFSFPVILSMVSLLLLVTILGAFFLKKIKT